ncbi:transmembrane protein 255A [Choloepus didactylus]|uniref:transmembrane protein 255A n=1 Tax=Choloepus didactylus TaxID=27675 RepID=UPI00189E1234|nr:transmembrane protein 255A [Choloepus didactylus]
MHQSLTQQRSSDMCLPDSMATCFHGCSRLGLPGTLPVWQSRLSLGSFSPQLLPDAAEPSIEGNSIYVTVTLLIVSVLILTVGLAATTRTQNVTVRGYYPGVILGFGSFLGIIGSNLVENKQQMLVASIVFISFGVIAAFCCAIVHGVFAARHIDLKPLYANRCHYVPKTSQKEAEEVRSSSTKNSPSTRVMRNLTQAAREVNCPHLSCGFCTPRIRGNTCFCCDLYNCGNWVEITGGYYEYIDVSSCQDIIHLYHLLWSATILNIVGMFLGINTAAVLGGFKDMNSALPALNCSVENAHPTVSYYARPQVASYNTCYHSPPHLPYMIFRYQHSSVFPSSPPSGLSDEPQSASPSPSYMWSSSAPPHYSPPYYPPFEKPPPYSP